MPVLQVKFQKIDSMNIFPFLRVSFVAFLLMVAGAAGAQNSNIDKSQADQFIYESLVGADNDDYEAERVDFKPSSLIKTNEKSVFILPGSHYQLETLRSDCYLRKTWNNNYVVISDLRYPMETFINQLLNKVRSGHVLQVKHHQYGQKVPLLKTPLQSLFTLFGPTMKSYATVTSVNEKEIEALLVFHHPKLDFIHLLTLKTSTTGLLKKGNVVYGDLYTNIPQDNVKSILSR